MTKILSFQTIEDGMKHIHYILWIEHSIIEQCDKDTTTPENSRYTKIDYTSELFCNISYRWITQNAYKLYKRKEIEQYLLVLHLINSK